MGQPGSRLGQPVVGLGRDGGVRGAPHQAVAADPAPHRGRTLDLVGLPVTAARVAARLGVPHCGIGLDEYRRRLLDEAPGLLPFQPPMLASIATGVRRGFLAGTTPDLADLLGRPAPHRPPVRPSARPPVRPSDVAAT
ncbi:hypothetical protein [Kitasatospora sp. NPDC004272]